MSLTDSPASRTPRSRLLTVTFLRVTESCIEARADVEGVRTSRYDVEDDMEL